MKAQKITAIVVTILLLAAALLLGSILLLRLFFLSVLVVALSYLWTVLSLRNLIVRTEKPPEHLHVGDRFQQKVTVFNTDRLPRLWLKLEDNTDLPGHADSTLGNIAGLGSYSWETDFTCRQRGRYYLGPLTVTASDPFGIFTRQRILGEPQDIIVYPTAIDLPHFKFSSFSDFGYGAGYQSISRISPNASSVREFASGDSLHHIHWPTTARMGKVMVKMFDADRSYNASKIGWILLDMNNDSHSGWNEDASDECAITVAASIIEKYVKGGMRVGLLAADNKQSLVMPERGEEHLWQLLAILALMKTGWKMTLSQTVLQNLDSIRDNPLVIIIATSATPNLMETIHQLKNRVDSVVVVLLDVASWGGRPLSTEIARTLTWSGAQVYTVRKSDELSQALDSKTSRRQPLLV